MSAEAGGSGSLLLLSGVNLGLLGERQPEVYGTATLEDHVELARTTAAALGLGLEHVQSDSESGMVAAVHAARGRHDALVVNPGAFTHYSWALHDALAAFEGPVVELHLSNPQSRERWRHTPWRRNAEVPGTWLRGTRGGVALPRGVTRRIDRALEQGAITMRGYDRTLRLAWTLAERVRLASSRLRRPAVAVPGHPFAAAGRSAAAGPSVAAGPPAALPDRDPVPPTRRSA